MPKTWSLSSRLRWQAVTVAVAMGLVLLVGGNTPFVKTHNLYFQDMLLRHTAQPPLPKNFVLVALDDKSLALDDLEPEELAQSRALQLMKQGYPWSREVYAPLLQKLFEAGARLVIFDIVLAGSRPGDEALAQVLAEHPGRVILASSAQVTDTRTIPHPVFPTEVLARAVEDQIGLANFPHWSDSKVRSVFLQATPSEASGKEPDPAEDRFPTLPFLAARALGYPIPAQIGTKPLRFFFSASETIREVPLYQIFVPTFWQKNFQDGAIFKDSVVLVGATAPVLHDFHATPLGTISGPEIQLHALAAISRGAFIGQSSDLVIAVSTILAALLIFGAAAVRHGIASFAIGLVLAAAGWILICALTLHSFSYFLPTAEPFLTLLTCGFAVLACDVTLERQERSRLRETFSLYVSKDIVNEIVENKNSFLHQLGGQRQEVVVLFSDLKGFTSDSEHLDPVELVTMLNEYFGEMVQAVFNHQGTFDKFIGDALMATWGGIRRATPEEDARQALLAAFDMKRRLALLNEKRRQRGLAAWGTGLGITQGQAIFGNIGSDQRREPTVIGDTVNLASRLEGLTRHYGCDMLISATLASHSPPEIALLEVDEVRVKGRRTPERLFHPYEKGTIDPSWLAAFAEARAAYLAGDFSRAATAFAALSHEKGLPSLAHAFRQRCEMLIREPRPSWDGIWDFAEK